jgi:hypothetical protein
MAEEKNPPSKGMRSPARENEDAGEVAEEGGKKGPARCGECSRHESSGPSGLPRGQEKT